MTWTAVAMVAVLVFGTVMLVLFHLADVSNRVDQVAEKALGPHAPEHSRELRGGETTRLRPEDHYLARGRARRAGPSPDAR